MKRFWLAALFVALCQPASAQQLVVTFAVPASLERPILDGSTNLPDGIEMTVSLHSPMPECRPHYQVWEAKTTVKDGRFVAGPFLAAPGNYELEIKTNLAELAPAAVRAIIGPHGENLRGPYIAPAVIQGAGPTVHYVAQVTVR
jgi:hypothetical protein